MLVKSFLSRYNKLYKATLFCFLVAVSINCLVVTIRNTKKDIYSQAVRAMLEKEVDFPRQVSEDIFKFIIIMATYERTDKRTPYYLKKAVRSIMMQTYSEWCLFVTGDNYINETELRLVLRNIPKDKLFLYNLASPGERGKVSGTELWYCVGATAMNNAIDRAEEKYQHTQIFERNKLLIAHLDDDDTWHPAHLMNLLNAYKRFPTVEFVWSKGYYCASGTEGTIFPPKNLPNTINNEPPRSGWTLHSSVSWKMKTFRSFRYRRAWDYIGEPPTVGDGDLWQRMTKFMLERNMSFYHSSFPTVEHMKEAQSVPCTKKADKQPLWYPD